MDQSSIFPDVPSSFFDFIPTPVVEPGQSPQVTCERTYSDSGTTWHKGLDERVVFHADLKGTGDDPDRQWQLRVGKGGQIYSLRGPFGESVAPQAHDGALWNDEVWQVVSVDMSQFNHTWFGDRKRALAYFIHGSGVYLRDAQRKEPFYCPMLATNWNPDRGAYHTVNWGQHAHVPTMFKSGALYYQRVRSPKPGVVEVTYVIYNFGPDSLHYYQMPWGGVRESTLPTLVMTDAQGQMRVLSHHMFNEKGARWHDFTKTAGWAAFVEGEAAPGSEGMPQAPEGGERHGLAVVFGKTRDGQPVEPMDREPSELHKLVAYGDGPRAEAGAAALRTGGSNRDYFVLTVNRWRRLVPGRALYARYYFVIDSTDRLAEAAESIVPHASDGLLDLPVDQAPQVTVSFSEEAGPNVQGKGKPLFKAYASPVNDGVPLFLIKDNEKGQLLITPDPYQLASHEPFDNPYEPSHERYEEYEGKTVRRPYDGRTTYLGLLGYGLRIEDDGSPTDGHDHLFEVLTDRELYPIASPLHERVFVPR